MSAKSVELADAIAALLNDQEVVAEALGNGFSLSFEAKRRAAAFAVEELEELRDVQVSVFTGATRRERLTRGSWKHTYRPIIAIQKYMPGRDEPSELAQIDSLELLFEEICTVFENDADLAELSFVSFDGEDERDPYNYDALGQLKVFSTIIELEYTDG